MPVKHASRQATSTLLSVSASSDAAYAAAVALLAAASVALPGEAR